MLQLVIVGLGFVSLPIKTKGKPTILTPLSRPQSDNKWFFGNSNSNYGDFAGFSLFCFSRTVHAKPYF